MLPDDANGYAGAYAPMHTTGCRGTGTGHGRFPAPPRSPSSPAKIRHPKPALNRDQRTGHRNRSNTVVAMAIAAQHIRRTCRRHHWRHAKRLSPTITDMMIFNWCNPAHGGGLAPLHTAAQAKLKHYMIILVDVRRHFIASHDSRSALMVDAALIRLAHMLPGAHQ